MTKRGKTPLVLAERSDPRENVGRTFPGEARARNAREAENWNGQEKKKE